MNGEQITKQIFFAGEVQGVGFRWTTNRIAAGYSVTGFVRNLSDGRVEIVAAGQIDTVDALTDAVCTHFAENITAVEQSTMTSPDTFDCFEIRR